MNKVILMGRLTADPELKSTNSGTQFCNFLVAVDRRFSKNGNRQTDFLNCVAWGGTAEFICKYFQKGNMIGLIGNIQVHSYDDAAGNKQYRTNIVIDEVYFTGEKKAQETGQDGVASNDEFAVFGFTEDTTESDLPF